MANVKNVDGSVAFVDGVDDPVDVWLTAKKQMAKFLIFWNDPSRVGKFAGLRRNVVMA